MQLTASRRTVRIAVDIGGTFTDIEILDEATGQTFAAKTPTTPDDPSEGLITGLRMAGKEVGFAFSDISALLHGTTIATNAVLQRRLPKGALITHEQAGGGGYGDPLSRDPALVREDIADGKITRAFATEHHGYRDSGIAAGSVAAHAATKVG